VTTTTRLTTTLAALALGGVVACKNSPGGNERGASNALERDSVGSTTTGTGVTGSGTPNGYAQPGQGGALGDTAQGRLPPAGGQAGPASQPSGAGATSGSGNNAAGGTRRP
jgi:hypothetical protein